MIPIFVLNFDKIRRQMKKYTWNADIFVGPFILSAIKGNIFHDTYICSEFWQNSSASEEIHMKCQYFCRAFHFVGK